jgi:hypothetical protein
MDSQTGRGGSSSAGRERQRGRGPDASGMGGARSLPAKDGNGREVESTERGINQRTKERQQE